MLICGYILTLSYNEKLSIVENRMQQGCGGKIVDNCSVLLQLTGGDAAKGGGGVLFAVKMKWFTGREGLKEHMIVLAINR